MVRRKIVKIDEERCNGCGLCVSACAEGAIQLIDGKARLVSDVYCDGLGACLGECPQGAITIEEREAEEFDPHQVEERLTRLKSAQDQKTCQPACACPGSAVLTMKTVQPQPEIESTAATPSMLTNWPVQLNLVPINAPYFQYADILLSADCTAFAHPDFHRKVLTGKVLIVGCPKLDDAQHYLEKLSEILRQNDVKSLTIARMEVPCCAGLTRIAQTAVLLSGKSIPVREFIISTRGEVRTSAQG